MSFTDRPGRFPHTAECRDDYCVHPTQCERDGTCPPSPGGQVEAERAWDQIREMYDRVADSAPVEPAKLTREQLDWLKQRVDVMPRECSAGCGTYDLGNFWATPIRLVETVEESTPYEKGWTGWHVSGHGVKQSPWRANGTAT